MAGLKASGVEQEARTGVGPGVDFKATENRQP